MAQRLGLEYRHQSVHAIPAATPAYGGNHGTGKVCGGDTGALQRAANAGKTAGRPDRISLHCAACPRRVSTTKCGRTTSEGSSG